MQIDTAAHDALAGLLSYPRAGFRAETEERVELVAAACPMAGGPLEAFLRFVDATSDDELEELYTRTFEVNPQCCLEVGWQAYGESYSRGVFLVRMRSTLAELGLPEGTELPDHLTNVLPVLGRIDEEDAADLARRIVVPAIRKMAVGLAPNDSPYESVLDAALLVLQLYAAEQNEEATCRA